jgi:hypothetical protein
VRSKYGTPSDALHRDCAGGKDVSDHLVFYLIVDELPQGIESGAQELYDFYPFHDPEDTCFAHSVIACRKQGSPEAYDAPTHSVRNKLKAQFVSAFEKNRIHTVVDK